MIHVKYFGLKNSYRVKVQISADPIDMASQIKVVGWPVLANLYNTPSMPSVGGFSVNGLTNITCIEIITINKIFILNAAISSVFLLKLNINANFFELCLIVLT